MGAQWSGPSVVYFACRLGIIAPGPNPSLFAPSSLSFPSMPLTPFVQKVDSTIHWLNQYPLDSTIGFAKIVIYPADSAIHCLNNNWGLVGKMSPIITGEKLCI